MKSATEKPLLEVSGKSMFERVVEALGRAKLVDRIVIAVTVATPLTARRAAELNLETLETPGEGYVSDMKYAIKKLGLSDVLIVSSDIPFITTEIIERAVRRFKSCGKPALVVMSPAPIYSTLGMHPEYVFSIEGKNLVPVGINLIDGMRIDRPELEQEVLVTDSETIALNVNTPGELELARKRYQQP